MTGNEPGKSVAIAKLGIADQFRFSHLSPAATQYTPRQEKTFSEMWKKLAGLFFLEVVQVVQGHQDLPLVAAVGRRDDPLLLQLVDQAAGAGILMLIFRCR